MDALCTDRSCTSCAPVHEARAVERERREHIASVLLSGLLASSRDLVVAVRVDEKGDVIERRYDHEFAGVRSGYVDVALEYADRLIAGLDARPARPAMACVIEQIDREMMTPPSDAGIWPAILQRHRQVLDEIRGVCLAAEYAVGEAGQRMMPQSIEQRLSGALAILKEIDKRAAKALDDAPTYDAGNGRRVTVPESDQVRGSAAAARRAHNPEVAGASPAPASTPEGGQS